MSETPDHGREYSGSAFICGDDAFQIEIEECSKDPSLWHYGEATHWTNLLPLPEPAR